MSHQYLVTPEQLVQLSKNSSEVVIVDVRPAEDYDKGHLPFAVQLDYGRMILTSAPVGGLLPETGSFNDVLRSLGIHENSHVVTYDGSGGAAASRLLWTLSVFGFERISLLDGGIGAWTQANLALVTETPEVSRSSITLSPTGNGIIEVEPLWAKLDDPSLVLLDARTIEEFTGENVRAEHGGRIPGAKHFEWTSALDSSNGNKLLPAATLQSMLDERGITKDKEVVVYCQTHQRSALSYIMLKHLGYPAIRALNGAWSNWGNRDDTPKELG